MDLFDTTQLALERATQAVGLRQRTIAENLANVNTAGYRRRDVQFHEALNSALSDGKQALKSVTFTPDVDQTAPLRGDGSNVDIDKEQSAMAQVGLEYDALIQVMRVRVQIMRMAIGPGQ
jgi:flagellar basal-body rod protein FlgB